MAGKSGSFTGGVIGEVAEGGSSLPSLVVVAAVDQLDKAFFGL